MVTKEQFYNHKEIEYPDTDPESIIRYNRAIDLVTINSGEKILDIGCKYATLKELLVKKNVQADYYGVDISSSVFHKIKDFNPDKFFVADASQNLPFENAKFDYVFALEIMEHVESPTIMLNEIYRVLKDTGRLILSVPNVYSWNEIIGNLFKQADTEGHISAFTHQIMERLMSFTKFKIEAYIGTYFRVPFTKRLLKTKYMLIKSNNIFLSRSFIYRVRKVE